LTEIVVTPPFGVLHFGRFSTLLCLDPDLHAPVAAERHRKSEKSRVVARGPVNWLKVPVPNRCPSGRDGEQRLGPRLPCDEGLQQRAPARADHVTDDRSVLLSSARWSR
jgi:hypothetical protein